tara:strand:- start:99 stop:1478 length:1380 start_codon:yes stop_codon:yes gene_type:complete
MIVSYLEKRTKSHSLAIYRFFFGLLMFFSLCRFWSKGWIDSLYIKPDFHFSYYLFEWVKPIGDWTYVIFIIAIISSLFVCVGYKYRISIIIFFISFTYIELMDKTTYLNHYYFISILSFLLIFLPAGSSFSIDSYLAKKSYNTVPKWTVDSLKLLISIVYIYAGLAKLNSDWLLEAMPLKIWLTSRYHFPIVGETLFQYDWFHYFMSWAGILYDLMIPFLLFYSRTRLFGFILVIIFHLLTKVLFPIGMFPYIMIVSSIIFFSPKFHFKIIMFIKKFIYNLLFFLNIQKNNIKNSLEEKDYFFKYHKSVLLIISLFFIIQLIFPFRYLLYPGELFWHEQGYRFSWRVMLVEKTGFTDFKIVNPANKNNFFYVDNSNFLTPFQEKQMSFQPDLILEFAHHLGDYYSYINKDIEVYVDNYVTLNGRKSQRCVSNTVNLYDEKESFKNKKWILPLNDEIKGL